MRLFKSLSFVDVYLFVWIVYLLQYFVFGATGTVYSRILVLFLLVTSIFFALYSGARLHLPLYLKGVALLLVVFTLYGSILMIDNDTIRAGYKVISSHYYLQHIYISLLPLYTFFYYSWKGELSKSKIMFWAVILFIVGILEFYQGRQQYMDIYDEQDFTNNMGYEILALFPLIFFFAKERFVQFLGIGVIMFFLLLSMKRGAILIGLICALVSVLYLIKDSRGSQKILVLTLFTIGIVIAIGFIDNLIESNSYFADRVDSTLAGDTSQRDVIYSRMADYFLEQSSFVTILFGAGANATIKIFGGFAHNDWLEIAVNQGLFGIIVYIVYWILFYRTWRSINFNPNIKMAVLLSLIIYFLMTLFSMSYDCMSLSSTFCLGICMGELSRQQCHVSIH